MTTFIMTPPGRLTRSGEGPGAYGFWSGFGVIFLCFFLSGATGLIYQVIWLRMLGLVFGYTVYAITTVLAAFMAGLALGSFIFARQAARVRNLVAAYGWLEVAIGISCALIPVLLWVAAKIYVGLYAALGLSYDAFSLVQFLLVFMLLLIPTTLMGGTLPVLSQALVKQDMGLGRKVGALYSVNTFGAVAGVVLAGYVLLPAFGNHITIAIAVMGNLLVGVLALAYSRRLVPAEAPPATGMKSGAAPPKLTVEAGASPLGARLTVIALGVSGAVSMIYEVCWTRAISLVIGSSTYAFTAMLVAFLVGIAAGSALYSWLWGDRRPSASAFAVLQAGIAATGATTLVFFEQIPEMFLYALRVSDSPSFVQLVQIAVSAASLLPFTLLIGATFPCAVAVAAHGAARVGRDVGEIYAVNTVGAIVGCVVVGFALIPAIGVNASIKTGIAINLVVGGVLFAPVLLPAARARMAGQPWRWSLVAVALVAAAGTFFLPAWDQRVMSSGPAVYAKTYLQAVQAVEGKGWTNILRSQEMLFYRDGRSGTVSVSRDGDSLVLRVNGKVDAGTGIDMPTQLMLGHLPMLLHREPLRVLVIGMGSGITAGAVLRHPVQRLDIVELEPAVLEASRYFLPIHGDVLKDARTRVIVADGRNYMTTTRETYDAIISEPSNPWIGRIASLFSAEFFHLARQHLRAGGLMAQWLQGYNLYSDDFRMIVNTFRSAFPHVTIWNTTPGDYLLLGGAELPPVNLLRVKERYQNNQKIRQDMDLLGLVGWAAPLGYFMLSDQDSARLAQGARMNTDGRLPLEFSAPRALYADTAEANWNLFRSYQTLLIPPVTPESEPELRQAYPWYSMGMTHLRRDKYADALTLLERALQIEPRYAAAQVGAASVQLRLKNPAAALALAQDVLGRQPQNGDALYAAGIAAEMLGRFQGAVAYLERAEAANSKGSLLHYNLGLAYARVKRYREAEVAFRKAIALSPRTAEAYNSLSRLLIELGRFEEAVSAADESLRRNPNFLWAHFNRAWALEKLGRFNEAAAGYENVLKLDPTMDEIKQKTLSLRAHLQKP